MKNWFNKYWWFPGLIVVGLALGAAVCFAGGIGPALVIAGAVSALAFIVAAIALYIGASRNGGEKAADKEAERDRAIVAGQIKDLNDKFLALQESVSQVQSRKTIDYTRQAEGYGYAPLLKPQREGRVAANAVGAQKIEIRFTNEDVAVRLRGLGKVKYAHLSDRNKLEFEKTFYVANQGAADISDVRIVSVALTRHSDDKDETIKFGESDIINGREKIALQGGQAYAFKFPLPFGDEDDCAPVNVAIEFLVCDTYNKEYLTTLSWQFVRPDGAKYGPYVQGDADVKKEAEAV